MQQQQPTSSQIRIANTVLIALKRVAEEVSVPPTRNVRGKWIDARWQCPVFARIPPRAPPLLPLLIDDDDLESVSSIDAAAPRLAAAGIALFATADVAAAVAYVAAAAAAAAGAGAAAAAAAGAGAAAGADAAAAAAAAAGAGADVAAGAGADAYVAAGAGAAEATYFREEEEEEEVEVASSDDSGSLYGEASRASRASRALRSRDCKRRRRAEMRRAEENADTMKMTRITSSTKFFPRFVMICNVVTGERVHLCCSIRAAQELIARADDSSSTFNSWIITGQVLFKKWIFRKLNSTENTIIDQNIHLSKRHNYTKFDEVMPSIVSALDIKDRDGLFGADRERLRREVSPGYDKKKYFMTALKHTMYNICPMNQEEFLNAAKARNMAANKRSSKAAAGKTEEAEEAEEEAEEAEEEEAEEAEEAEEEAMQKELAAAAAIALATKTKLEAALDLAIAPKAAASKAAAAKAVRTHAANRALIAANRAEAIREAADRKAADRQAQMLVAAQATRAAWAAWETRGKY